MDIDEKAGAKITPELYADEKLLWAGRPARGLAFGSHDVFLVPFSLLWCGFAIPFGGLMLFMGGLSLQTFVGGIFFFIGVHFLVGRFLLDIFERMNTFYGVSDERVLIRRGWLRKSIRSLPLSGLQDVRLVERMDGSGTIEFGQSNPLVKYQAAVFKGAGSLGGPSFFRIPGAIEVLGLLHTAVGKARAA